MNDELTSEQIDKICDEAVKLADAQPGDERALWRAAYHGAMLARSAIATRSTPIMNDPAH